MHGGIITSELIGYLASCLVFLTFCMKTMMPLRILAISSNAAFIAYGYANALVPILILHSMLLPLNVFRTAQIWKTVRKIRSRENSASLIDDLLPFMAPEFYRAGETVFRRGDRVDKLFFVEEGQVRIDEYDIVLEPNSIFGEIGMFSTDHSRTATVSCVTECRLRSITEEQVRLLYFQNPEFGYSIVRLITRRLLEDIKKLEERVGSAPETTKAGKPT